MLYSVGGFISSAVLALISSAGAAHSETQMTEQNEKLTITHEDLMSGVTSNIVHLNTCIAGRAREALAAMQEDSNRVNGSIIPQDDISYCSLAARHAFNADYYLEPFMEAAIAKFGANNPPEYLARGANAIRLLILKNADQVPNEGGFNMGLGKGWDGRDVVLNVTPRHVLYAQLLETMQSNDRSAANTPIPQSAKDCFDASVESEIQACRGLGKIIAGNALNGRKTTRDD